MILLAKEQTGTLLPEHLPGSGFAMPVKEQVPCRTPAGWEAETTNLGRAFSLWG